MHRVPLILYNTFSKHEEQFISREKGVARMYTCGPTVYGRPHVGNYSSFLMADLLRRWLEAGGYAVLHVKNITDVGHLVADRDEGEDKVEMEARRLARERGAGTGDVTMKDVLAVAQIYEKQFLEDEKALNMLEPMARPRASETIPEMIAVIETLVANGYAYETDDGVYFAVERFPGYGKLSGNTIAALNAGARIEIKEDKKHPADFALWKKCRGGHAKHVLRWPSPWGDGFPGWHIECSAMAMKFLGSNLDIHTGGEDNIFPHHEAEIAQSESSGTAPFARFWLHKRRIDMGGEKMSKSLGNILTLPDIVARGFSPLDLRYYFLSVHYRTNLKFSWKGMEDARKARRKILEWMTENGEWGMENETPIFNSSSKISEYARHFIEAMDSDLNTPAALAAVFDCMTWSRRAGVETSHRAPLRSLIDLVRRTFGCFELDKEKSKRGIPTEVQKCVEQREEARSRGDFAESDRLRDLIRGRGFEVRDTKDGPTVRSL